MKRLPHRAALLVSLAACSGSVDVNFAATSSGETSGSTASGAGQTSSGVVGSSNAATTGNGAATGASTSTGFGGAGTAASASSASASTGAGGGMVCPGFGDPCTSCVSTACPSVFCACSNNAECLALSACFNNCGDAACEQACQTAHPNGISDLYLLSDCAGTSCPAECPGNQPLDPCTKCVIDTCPDALNVCLADPECVALYQCLNSCGNVDLMCQQGCYAQHGGGTMKLQKLFECETSPCGADCK